MKRLSNLSLSICYETSYIVYVCMKRMYYPGKLSIVDFVCTILLLLPLIGTYALKIERKLLSCVHMVECNAFLSCFDIFRWNIVRESKRLLCCPIYKSTETNRNEENSECRINREALDLLDTIYIVGGDS